VLKDPTMAPFVVPFERVNVPARSNISEGGFGVVHRALLRPSKNDVVGQGDRKVAVKEMKGDQARSLYELLKEAHVAASLCHANICKFVGICTDGRPRGRRFIIFEMADCSLFDFVHRTDDRARWRGNFDIPSVIGVSEGICAGLAYMHARSLVHADLKSANVLLEVSDRLVPRICDFGHVAVRTTALPHDRLCTPHWAAPEVLRGEGLGPAADIFSFGVLLWEMLVNGPGGLNTLPHSGHCFGQVIASVGWAGRTPDMDLLPLLPRKFRSLLQQCLAFIPEERPSANIATMRLRRMPNHARNEALRALVDFMVAP
jgi:serine/threonine-protein kinase